MPGAQNTDHLKHVVIFGAENRHSAKFFGNPAAGASVELFGGSESDEHAMTLAKAVHGFRNRTQVAFERIFYFSAVLVKVECSIMAVLVSATNGVRRVFHQRWLHRPPEWIDRANDQHRQLAIPTGIQQNLAAILGRKRLERPRRVGAQLSWHAELS